MSLKHEVNEMIAGKLPAKGNRLKNGIVASGLRQRPQMEQIVDYLNFGQEKMQIPNREAKQIRNHPIMTQLDFFDMQEDQEKQWEEQKKQHQAMELARTLGMSAAQFQATRQPIALPDRDPNAGGGGGGQSSGAASSSGYGRGQPPIQRSRGGVPLEAIEDGRPRYDPYASMWRGNSQTTWTMPANIARELWTQDAQMTEGGTAIEDDATDRVAQARQNEDTQRQARQHMASFLLGSPFQPVPPSFQDVFVTLSDPQGRTIGTMPSRNEQVRTRLVAHNMGNATEVMDARAQAAQNTARIAEVQLSSAPAAASNYDQLESAVKPVDRNKKNVLISGGKVIHHQPITKKSSPLPFASSAEAKSVNRGAEAVVHVHPKAKPKGPVYPKAKQTEPVVKKKQRAQQNKPIRSIKKDSDIVPTKSQRSGSKAGNKAANVTYAQLHKFARQNAAAMKT